MCRLLFAEARWQVFAGRFELLEGAGRAEGGVGNVRTVSLDVSSTDSVQKAVLQVQEKTDCIDMLIHCGELPGRTGDDAPRKILQVNSVGALRVAEAFCL